MKIYPEPGRDKLWLEFSDYCEGESVFSVYDDKGSLMILKKVNRAMKGDTLLIDLSKLGPGHYQLVLEVDNRKHFRKIVLD